MSKEADPADALREMAQHRGFKLLKSRRRKPGVGDFGLFGLSDSSGKPIMGVGPDGLTALPREIEAFLRAGALDTWRESAKALPKVSKKEKARPSGGSVSEKAGLRPHRDKVHRRTRVPKGHHGEEESEAGSIRSATLEARGASSSNSDGVSTKSVLSVPAKSTRLPELVVRRPTKKDLDLLAALLGELPGIKRPAREIARDLSFVQKAGGGMLLADQGGAIGFIAWAIVATVHRGPVGRITALVVTRKERRKGVGRKLVGGALTALVAAGCTTVEAMSDIDIRNAHNFFRSLGFAQASYRFTRSTAQTGT